MRHLPLIAAALTIVLIALASFPSYAQPTAQLGTPQTSAYLAIVFQGGVVGTAGPTNTSTPTVTNTPSSPSQPSLTISNYETKFNLIDESLLFRRNRIAHGEFLDVGPREYADLSDEVVTLMRSYKIDIENSLTLKSYLSM